MKKHPLTPADKALVAAAIEAAKKPVRQLWDEKAPPYVAAALKLDNGQVITAANLLADVGSLSLCAEPHAIAEAVRQPKRKIQTIVAVYHDPGLEPKVVSPCGRCREVITDYAQNAFVILRAPGKKTLFKVKATDLLPMKYGTYWHHRELI
jgi:cytidine deaminase